MSNHHHKKKAVEAYNKARGVALADHEPMASHPGEVGESEDIQRKLSEDDSSVRLRAYQIYREKGGAALDNWLEAERAARQSSSRKLS